MRWRRERAEKKFLMSWTVIQTTFGSRSLRQAKVFVPEKLTSVNYQLPSKDSFTMHYLEDYRVAAAVLPLMPGIPWLIYTSLTFYATGQADLVLPRLTGATMGHPTSPKHGGLTSDYQQSKFPKTGL